VDNQPVWKIRTGYSGLGLVKTEPEWGLVFGTGFGIGTGTGFGIGTGTGFSISFKNQN